MNIRGVPVPNKSIASVPTYFLSGTDDWAIEDTRFDETLQRAVDWILSR